jgi:hypothetical protein
MNRPYVPKLRDIPLTFMGCHMRRDYGSCACCNPRNPGDCEIIRKRGFCRRGFR